MNLMSAVFRPKQFTGWHMFGVLVLFFGTIISVNMVLAFSASSTWTGLVVKNTYVESQKFTTRQVALKEQQSMAWQVGAEGENGRLRVSVKDKAGLTIDDAIVIASLGRPVHEGEDHQIQLLPKDDTYEAPIELAEGAWRVRLHITGPKGETWLRTKRFTVTDDGTFKPIRLD